MLRAPEKILLVLLLATSARSLGAQEAAPAPALDTPSLESVTGPGPFTVEMIRELDGVRDGPSYSGSTIYFPTDAEPPFAGIVIVPGYRADESSVGHWGPYLASHGIVTMTIGTNKRGDRPEQRANALLDAVVSLQAENVREDSPLFGRIDSERMGVGGWSMGGGGAQQAAVQDPELDAVLALCPWEPGHAFKHTVPVMILAGERDRPAPTSLHALVHYNKTPEGTPKLLFEVKDGSHYLPFSPAFEDGEVGRVALVWLKVFLVGDDRYRPLLQEKPKSASRYLIELPKPEARSPDEKK